jgi:hypothetical protein
MNITTILVTIVFLLVIFILPILSSHFRKNKNLIFIYYFVVLLYQIVAFTNVFWFRTIGADMDANSFHVMAVEISNLGVFKFDSDANLYKNILGLLYWLTGSSHIIGEQLSILAIAISMIIFVKIIDLFQFNEYQTPLIFIYAAQPTMVLLGAITLREPLQIFLLITAFYFGLKMRIYETNKILNFSLMVLFSVMMGYLHKALFLYSVVLIGVLLVWNINKPKKLFVVSKYRLFILFFAPIILFIFAYIAANSDVSGSELFRQLSSGDLLKAIAKHRLSTPIGRASYDIIFDISSYPAIAYSSFLAYVHYLFAPFIWQVSSVVDIYACLESIAHLILIYYAIKLWRLEKGRKHQLLGMLLVLFFIMSLMWALGSTNYGTAMRHKLLSWWMLVLMGGPLFYKQMRSLLINIKYKND